MFRNILTKIRGNASTLNEFMKARKDRGVHGILQFLDNEGIYPAFHAITNGVNEPEVEVDGKKYLMFCSNNYLSLTQHPEVKEAAISSIKSFGVGPGGSRVINGDVEIIRELEREIADLTGTEDCLTFPTGYMANIAVFQALTDPLFFDLPYKSAESVIFSDEYNHGSIIDGCRLSKARKIIFKHNDIVDLEKKIRENDLPNKLIVTEGVFSLDGEILDLPAYLNLAKSTGSRLMIDDAHGVGILGKSGGGTPDYHNCAGQVDILMGCMDKAFGGTGGYLCGSKEMIRYLRIASRSSILSSALPTGMAGAMVKSARIIKDAHKERDSLFEMSAYLRHELTRCGFKILGRDNLPAIALYVGDEKLGIKFANLLWERQIFSPIVRWPAVPQGESRFRILISTAHTKEQIDRFVEASEEIGKELQIIK